MYHGVSDPAGSRTPVAREQAANSVALREGRLTTELSRRAAGALVARLLPAAAAEQKT
jgi:hypothetical protein